MINNRRSLIAQRRNAFAPQRAGQSFMPQTGAAGGGVTGGMPPGGLSLPPAAQANPMSRQQMLARLLRGRGSPGAVGPGMTSMPQPMPMPGGSSGAAPPPALGGITSAPMGGSTIAAPPPGGISSAGMPGSFSSMPMPAPGGTATPMPGGFSSMPMPAPGGGTATPMPAPIGSGPYPVPTNPTSPLPGYAVQAPPGGASSGSVGGSRPFTPWRGMTRGR